jgi:hypothetical protein
MSWSPGQPPRESIDEDELGYYDEVTARLEAMGLPKGDAGPYHGTLLWSPPLAATISNFGRLVRAGQLRGTYSHAQREFVDVVLSTELGWDGVLPFHIPDALAVGVRIEAIEAVREGRIEDLNEEEQQLREHILAVVRGEMNAERWQAMEDLLGTRGVVEYTIFVAFLLFTMRLMAALGFEGPPAGAVEQMLAEFRDGTRELPDPEAHIV